MAGQVALLEASWPEVNESARAMTPNLRGSGWYSKSDRKPQLFVCYNPFMFFLATQPGFEVTPELWASE